VGKKLDEKGYQAGKNNFKTKSTATTIRKNIIA